jgi:hypothetical protein
MKKIILIVSVLYSLVVVAQNPTQQFFSLNVTASGGGYSPPPITSGLAYDYDPAFGVTLSGGYVSTIASQQSSNTLTNADPTATNPIVITPNAINGYDVIDFSSVPASMNVGLVWASLITGEHTMFIVGSYTYAGEVLVDDNTFATYLINRADKYVRSDATPLYAYTPVAGTFYTFSSYQTSGGNVAVGVNDNYGSEVAGTMNYYRIGGFGFSNGYQGKIARVIIYNTKLSSGDITTVNNYLKARYGHY